MRAEHGCWRKGGSTLSWASTITPSKYFHPPLSPLSVLPLAPVSVHPSSCALAPQRCSLPRSLRVQITFFLLQDLGLSGLPSSSPRPSIPPWGSSTWSHSYLLSSGLHTCSGLPSPKYTILRFSLTSPPRRPSSLPVLSLPCLFQTWPAPSPFLSNGPRLPDNPPLPLVPLPWVSPSLALPILPSPGPPMPPPRTKPPEFLHHRTWPAGCRPPHAGLRPEQEEGGETEGDQGKPSWPCRRDSPASGSAPRPAPGPKPTLPHPSRTEPERLHRAAPQAWRGGHGGRGVHERTRRRVAGLRGPGVSPPSLWGIHFSPPLAPCRAGRCWVQCPRPWPDEARRSAQQRPPASARGQHPSASRVRQALAGCAPRVGPDEAAAAGPRMQ